MDSPEHRAITQCYPKLCSLIQQSPTGVATHLKPLGILSSEDWAFITNLQNNDDKKAIRIVDAVLNQVELDSQVFPKFVSALEASGSWTRTVVGELKQILESLLPCCTEERVSGSGDSGATNMGEGGCGLFSSFSLKYENNQRLSIDPFHKTS